MSGKHKRHRPGKGSASTLPQYASGKGGIKIAPCRKCGKISTVLNSDGKCHRKKCNESNEEKEGDD